MGLNRYKLILKVQSRLAEFFVLEVTAHSAASVLGLQPNTAALYYRKLRQLIADQSAKSPEWFCPATLSA
jgi:transposase